MHLPAPEMTIAPYAAFDNVRLNELAETAAAYINYEAETFGTMNYIDSEKLKTSLGWFVLAAESILVGHVRLVDTGATLRVSSLWVAQEMRSHHVGHDLADVATVAGRHLGRQVDAITRTPDGVRFFEQHGYAHDAARSPRGKFLMVHGGVGSLALGEQIT